MVFVIPLINKALDKVMNVRMPLIVMLCFCLIGFKNTHAQQLESLKTALKNEKDPMAQLKLLGQIGDKCDIEDIETYANQTLDVVNRLNADIKKKNEKTVQLEQARAYYNLSYYFIGKQLYSVSQGNAQKAILILEENHLDTALLIASYNNMASAYMYLNKYDQALPYFKKNLIFDRHKKDEPAVANDCNNLSSAFKGLRQHDSAIYYAKQCIAIREQLDHKLYLINNYRLLGSIYLDENNFDSAQVYVNKALNYAVLLNDKNSFQALYYTKGLLEKKKGNAKDAQNYFLQALSFSRGLNSYTSIIESHHELYQLFDVSKDYAQALYHYKLYQTYKDSALSEDMKKDSDLKQMQFDTENKTLKIEQDRQIERAIASEKDQKQRLLIWFAACIIVLIIVFLLFVLNRARLLRQQKKFIEEQRDLLSTQQEELVLKNELLDKKNTTITENINYAQNIQGSLIPSEQTIAALLNKECFVLFSPKDIVSGDFYWTFAKNNKQLLVLADCTGHGVTGAFISILAIKSLEKVVSEVPITDLESILKQLHKDFSLTFRDASNDHFGIELVLCCFDSSTSELLISGSSNSVCIVHQDELNTYQFESISIGTKDADLNNIKTHKVELKPSSHIYLFTDGYYDQKGGPQNKKYLSKKLKSTFVEIAHLPIVQQKEILTKNYLDWKKDNEQIDDVSVIGIRI